MSPARYASDDDMDAATWCRHLVPDRSVYATGVLGGRRRRVLDSTVLEDAVATQDTVTQLVAAIRRVRRLIPAARAVKLGAHDYDRPGKPDCDCSLHLDWLCGQAARAGAGSGLGSGSGIGGYGRDEGAPGQLAGVGSPEPGWLVGPLSQ
jgi:hypothetical protein